MNTKPWRQALIDGSKSGTVAAATSALTLALCGYLEGRGPAAPLNGPSRWLWGRHASYERKATLRHTAVGVAIHHMTSVLWAVMHEKYRGADKKDAPQSVASIVAPAVVTTATAYVIDYYVTPPRFQPGFDAHLGKSSMFAVYASFALGLAALKLLDNSRHATK
jgi:hypothetical protein